MKKFVMEIPQRGLEQLDDLPSVSLGYCTIHIFCADRFSEAQVGYSQDSSGRSLMNNAPGAWQSSWLVIGYEDLLGDPIFIDTAKKDLPVFTAAHGAGFWKPVLIAISLGSFADAIREVFALSKDRENPVLLQGNPIPAVAREKTLSMIESQNPGINNHFWETILES